MISPWAMLMTPIRPKVMANPNAATKRIEPRLKPRKSVPHTSTTRRYPSMLDTAFVAAAATAGSESPESFLRRS